jgi:putative membrane protein
MGSEDNAAPDSNVTDSDVTAVNVTAAAVTDTKVVTRAESNSVEQSRYDGGPWQKLDPKMMLVRPVVDLIRSLPVLFGTLILGHGSSWQWIGVAVTALTMVISIGHCLTARYRITDEYMELKTGIVRRKHRSVPRDRIRTVDITAEAKHRLFGLSAVKIGTGRHTKDRSDELVLDAVSKVEAHRLASVLLHRVPASAPGASQLSLSDKDSTESEVTLAQFEKSWIRYSPFALSGLATVAVVVGLLYRFADELHLTPQRLGLARNLVDHFSRVSLGIAAAESAVALLLIVVLFSVAGYVLSFGNYKLSKGKSALHVRRGLITTRSVSMEEERLRGLVMHEPLPARLMGGARCLAVASGLAPRTGSSVIVPLAPVSLVRNVAATVLGEKTPLGEKAPLTDVPLTGHPRSASRRRMSRALGGLLIIGLVLFLGSLLDGFPDWPWQACVVLIPFVVLLAQDRYRNLGHALTENYVIGRSGSLVRETFLLRRTGVIGWKISQSLFQRRSGLVTVTATVAAGKGGYEILDLAEQEAWEFADKAIPGLLTPFLEYRR